MKEENDDMNVDEPKIEEQNPRHFENKVIRAKLPKKDWIQSIGLLFTVHRGWFFTNILTLRGTGTLITPKHIITAKHALQAVINDTNNCRLYFIVHFILKKI